MFIPTATYRIQFNPKFNFSDLTSIADYLQQLGITAIYASPLLQPVKGSEHGYNGIDPASLNPEIGSVSEWETLSALLKSKGIGWIQDIVPNHLAFDPTNVWLKDVLERGIYSSYASHFDIDWEHPFYKDKLMVPFLEADIAVCIEDKKLSLCLTEEGFFICHSSGKYPLNIDCYPTLLSGCFEDEFNHVNAGITALLNNIKTDINHWQLLKHDLMKQLEGQAIKQKIDEKISRINEDKKGLLDILSGQHYMLCYHMDSHVQVNYRRFFNVNGLICLRIEDEHVFNDYHRFTSSLYEKGLIQGLRIDHIDGLKNPREYIDRLRNMFGPDCYIVVEKILDVKEHLPKTLDIEGTSGYEFLSYINQVITDQKGSQKLLELYNRYVPQFSDYDTTIFKNKLSNLESYLNGEWDNLLRLLLSLNLIDDEEIRMTNLKTALGGLMTSYPVYRSYIDHLPLENEDMQLVNLAFEKSLMRYPDLHYELDILRQLFEPSPDESKNNNRLFFIQRLMQFTGPITAKGIEDTTFYQYNPLISHNEVGDQPCVLGISVKAFHEKMEERQQVNPFSFNCTSTHDTKRGEDNRMRINIISELVEEWTQLVDYWQKINAPFRKQLKDIVAPVVNDEYFLYQAILGGFPEDLVLTGQFVSRTKIYFSKALRESKQLSDYINPNVAYENACSEFIDHLLNSDHTFLPSFTPFVKKIIEFANIYSMVQVIIKITAPGIPDIYQGCELWDLSYVDPDNRRPVDYILRKKLLNELKQKDSDDKREVLEWAKQGYSIGTEKMYVTKEVLQLRKNNPDVFLYGDYIPLYPSGSNGIVIAYIRHYKESWILMVLPLGIVTCSKADLHLSLPDNAPRQWSNVFTNEQVTASTINTASLFDKFPVAVFKADGII